MVISVAPAAAESKQLGEYCSHATGLSIVAAGYNHYLQNPENFLTRLDVTAESKCFGISLRNQTSSTG